MSELDLFGEEIKADKKPMKKLPPVVVAAVRQQPEFRPTVFRPYTVEKTGRNEVMIINSDCAHLFR